MLPMVGSYCSHTFVGLRGPGVRKVTRGDWKGGGEKRGFVEEVKKGREVQGVK